MENFGWFWRSKYQLFSFCNGFLHALGWWIWNISTNRAFPEEWRQNSLEHQIFLQIAISSAKSKAKLWCRLSHLSKNPQQWFSTNNVHMDSLIELNSARATRILGFWVKNAMIDATFLVLVSQDLSEIFYSCTFAHSFVIAKMSLYFFWTYLSPTPPQHRHTLHPRALLYPGL